MIEADELAIGVGGFVRIEWRNRRAEFSFYIGDDKYRYPTYINEAINKLLSRGFYDYGFNKITWPIYSHDPSLDVYKETFKTEAVLKKEYFWNGKFQDRIYLSLLREEFDNAA